MGVQVYKTGIVNVSGDVINDNMLTNTHEFIIPSGATSGMTTDRYNGFIIRHLTAREGSSYRDFAYYNSYVSVVSEGVYTQSFWAKGTGKLRCHFYGGSSYCNKNESSQGVTTTATDGNIEITLSSDWQRYWVTHTLRTISGDPAKKNILLRLMDGTNEVYICGWKLEEGAIATPWTMNPNDTGYVGNIHGFMEITQTPTQFYEDRIDTIDFIEY